ncbi:hypothetical protein [Zavarzinella formosa]|uniref:hypothetical protein n=1 Tax=Zavarzinella formosa TaxID=360055 RepID=UPI0003034CEF|nr:hypothetical protein [Zavarzinella formosa]
MTNKKQVKFVFRGGPLNNVVLDGQSASGPERNDVTWLLAKTGGGKLGSIFRETEGLRSLGRPVSTGTYSLTSIAEDDDERYHIFKYAEENQC